ncbi:amylo-alpha-1,6-glucosidase [Fodinisporobacter ferrooxydans]|uniref:Amylo-alpha-1,6-glucosidase n=1 Tax=Fodinisporobacter ferrooxydans TaxID=2901836 RepID=A0ABY4CT03_9BACL|nr:amylo-alpha-1,6-glucosidase [Alicyclobacillaceae bacterium MYW30-H2]
MEHRIIKEDNLFLFSSHSGDISQEHAQGYGLFTKDTRFLSEYRISTTDVPFYLLHSAADQNYKGKLIYTNREVRHGDAHILRADSVLWTRQRWIYQDVFYETIEFDNRGVEHAEFEMHVDLAADFLDMFAVRGYEHGNRGEMRQPDIQPREVTFRYTGSDQVKRATKIVFDQAPVQSKIVDEDRMVVRSVFHVRLPAGQTCVFRIAIQPEIEDGSVKQAIAPKTDQEALAELESSYETWRNSCVQVESDNEQFDEWIHRSIQDIRVLLTDLGHGWFPVAGTPIYAVPFGRDSIIAAIQTLIMNPSIARSTLLTLADYPGTKIDPWRDEQPGKILHEIRYGELANTNTIPHTPYYGTIDATPLFLVLLAEYVEWTGDQSIVTQLLPQVEGAINWIFQYGDRDQDFYVEYYQESSKGIANQGWKDSGDSVRHADGRFAEAPIALIEVQGYVYDAFQKLAVLFEHMGRIEQARKLSQFAQQLRQKFQQDFWCDSLDFPPVALDKEKQPVGTVTSNPGHALWSGIYREEQAKRVAEVLTGPLMFSGYGIRTMASSEVPYNPASYHNGSVWPHDNSLIALGMKKYGLHAQANTVIEGLFRAAKSFEYRRLPELFCGFDFEQGDPVPYPVACSPQAWAAGTAPVLLQTMLGLFPSCLQRKIYLNPQLIKGVNNLRIRNLRIHNGTLAINVERSTADGAVKCVVLENTTGLDVVLMNGCIHR